MTNKNLIFALGCYIYVLSLGVMVMSCFVGILWAVATYVVLALVTIAGTCKVVAPHFPFNKGDILRDGILIGAFWPVLIPVGIYLWYVW